MKTGTNVKLRTMVTIPFLGAWHKGYGTLLVDDGRLLEWEMCSVSAHIFNSLALVHTMHTLTHADGMPNCVPKLASRVDI